MLRKPKLRVLIATPFGARQRGGIDRLTDLIIDTMENCPDISASRLVTRGPGKLLWAPLVFATALLRLYLFARRGDVDLLHINVAAGGSVYRKALLARLARYVGVRYIVHVHGSRFDRFWLSLRGPVRRFLVSFFADAETVIVLGQYWARFIAEQIPAAHEKITILPNATMPASSVHRASDGVVRISFLGEVGPRKGTLLLIDALGQLAHRRDWNATIAGNGQLGLVQARAQELCIADRVNVLGWVDASGVEAVLNRSDILVLPSFAENLPMSILEAFAHGVAVIATPVGAITEIITHGCNGLIVPTGDVGEITNAIVRLIEDVDLRLSLGAAAKRDHAERYEISGYVARLTTMWRQAAHCGWRAGPGVESMGEAWCRKSAL